MTIERALDIGEQAVGDGGPGSRTRRNEPVPPVARLSPWWSWRRQPTMVDNMMGLALLAGPANVIMQLARPGVGYGVVDSKVESGRADLHPVKRARTTFTYLAVATMGSPEQKAAFRKATNRSHAQVRSAPEDAVQYNAFDPDLQKWVAICLYKGFVDVYEAFVGPMTADMAERCLKDGAVMGTTLQMPLAMWPKSCEEYDTYWEQSLDLVHIDDHVRPYLYRIASAAVAVPPFLRRPVGAFSRLMTTGFLPQKFRDEMRLPWSPSHERTFGAIIAVLAMINRLLPNALRRFPFNALMIDLNWRIRTGRDLV
ncbi:oxygenase MpaB family protein [Mycobacterium sp. NPDC050853]|uniref:oxygenase MpaB family protein n=1 Tax=Mycobacterium sp. NPDC050853 TaxID=3155160 RepID=UPI0034032B51